MVSVRGQLAWFSASSLSIGDYKYLVSSFKEVLSFIRALFLAPIYLVLAPIVQLYINLLCGPYSTKDDRAYTYDILWNLKYYVVMANSFNKFLLKFRSSQDISVIEDNDVSLYCVNEKNFVFARAKAGTNLYDCDKHPFLFLIQHSSAIELITVSHEALFRYQKSKPVQNGNNITICYMNGRCGSTLAASMINKTGQCVVLSEPFILLDICFAVYTGSLAVRAKRDKLIKAGLLAVCKDPNQRYFIKMPMVTGILVRVLKNLLPRVRELYMYRAWRPCMSSYRKMFGPFAMTILAGLMVPTCAVIQKHKDLWKKYSVSDPYKKWMFWMFCNMEHFYDEAKERKELKSFSYESLRKDKEGFIRNLLAHIGIGPEYVKQALSALDQDSQENSPWSRKKLAGKYGKLPEETYQWARKVGREFGIETDTKEYMVSNFPNRWESNHVTRD